MPVKDTPVIFKRRDAIDRSSQALDAGSLSFQDASQPGPLPATPTWRSLACGSWACSLLSRYLLARWWYPASTIPTQTTVHQHRKNASSGPSLFPTGTYLGQRWYPSMGLRAGQLGTLNSSPTTRRLERWPSAGARTLSLTPGEQLHLRCGTSATTRGWRFSSISPALRCVSREAGFVKNHHRSSRLQTQTKQFVMTDSGNRFLFSAAGVWEEPVIQGCFTEEGPRGEEQLCIMGNSQVSGRLSSPVSISPQLPIYPYTPFEPARRCVDRSYDPEWVIENFAYKHHSSQLAGKSERFYDLSVALTSTSTGEKSTCDIRVDELHADPKRSTPWVKCSSPSGPDPLTSSTEVMLDPEYGILGVRQAWRCTDGIEGIDL